MNSSAFVNDLDSFDPTQLVDSFIANVEQAQVIENREEDNESVEAVKDACQVLAQQETIWEAENAAGEGWRVYDAYHVNKELQDLKQLNDRSLEPAADSRKRKGAKETWSGSKRRR